MNLPNRTFDRPAWWRVTCHCPSVLSGLIAVLVGACASTGTGSETQPATQLVPQPVGEHYLIHYADASGVRRRDTRDRTDLVLLPASGSDVVAGESPDRRKIAVAYRQPDSTLVAIVDVVTGEAARVHAVATSAVYTLAWSQDGQQLAVGYRVTATPAPAGPASGVFVADLDGSTRDVGCSVSNRVFAWVANGNLAVGDGRNAYVVNPRGCRTLATIPLRDKQDVIFSPDGRKMTLRRSPADQFSRQRAGNRLELYVADFNGANARRVTDYRYEARNARWSPDSRKIAFELQSQQFANVTHVAVYDVARNQATFDAKARTLGQPNDGNPHWAPSGTMLVHDRVYARRSAGQAYITNQKVVKTLPPTGGTLSDAAEQVIAEELGQTGGAVTGEPAGRTWGWVDDRHLAFSSSQWTRVVNIETEAAYDLPGDVVLLSVVVLDAPL